MKRLFGSSYFSTVLALPSLALAQAQSTQDTKSIASDLSWSEMIWTNSGATRWLLGTEGGL